MKSSYPKTKEIKVGDRITYIHELSKKEVTNVVTKVVIEGMRFEVDRGYWHEPKRNLVVSHFDIVSF